MDMQRCYGCMKQKTQRICEHCGYDPGTENAPHQLTAGTILQNRYLVGKVLGQGGFGITYLGWDSFLEVPVAIKEYFPSGMVMRDNSQSTSVTSIEGKYKPFFEKNRERFLREAKTLVKFANVPEIVHILNLFMDNNTAYIVMEYVEGITMKDYIFSRGGRITAHETFAILRPVMEALSKVHETGLVHRDISPDNIMMLSGGGAKLLDFGAVRDVGDTDVDKVLTKSTEAILKHGFAPIEQYQSRGGLGPWTDVYALCATIYYCLTGRVPADAPLRVMGDGDVDWYQVPGLTSHQAAVLDKGMSLTPKTRIRSVGELYQCLFSNAAPVSGTMPASAPGYSAGTVPVNSRAGYYPTGTQAQDSFYTAPVSMHGPHSVSQGGYSAGTVPLDPSAVNPPVARSMDDLRTAPVSRPSPRNQSPMPAAAPVIRETPAPQPKKRKSGLLIALLAAATAVVGCLVLFLGGGKDTPAAPMRPAEIATPAGPAAEPFSGIPERISLTVWGPSNEIKNSDSFLPVACRQFAEANPQWEIEFKFEACHVGDAGSMVSKDPGAAADVYMFSNDQLGTLWEAGALAKLDGAVLEQIRSDNSETMLASVCFDGDAYGVPYSGNTWFMYYDKSVYSAEDIQSLEAMMAKKPVAFPVTNTWYLPAFFFANGCTMFGDGTDASAGINFGGKAGADAALYVANALASGRLVPDDNGSGLEMLQRGKVGAIFSGTWDAMNVKEMLGDNFGAAQLPCITINGQQKQLYSFYGSKAIGVNPHCDHPQAAAALAAWLGSAEMQDLHYLMTGGEVIPCSNSLLATGKYSSDPAAIAQNHTIANASKLQPSIPEMAVYWSNANPLGQDLANGKINAGNVSKKVDAWNNTLS